nr:MAG: nonstructural protein [Army ant associated chapparvovirus 8]
MVWTPRYSRKQWFAIRAAKKRTGTWDSANTPKRKPNNPGPGTAKQRKYPQKNTLDNYKAPETIPEAFFDPANDPSSPTDLVPLDNTAEGKSMSMNDGGGNKKGCDFFSESSADSCEQDAGQVSEGHQTDPETNVEGEDLQCYETMPDSPVPVLSEGGDLCKETREIDRAFRHLKVGRGTRERIRVARVPETAGSIRDNTLILNRHGKHVFWGDIKPEFTDIDITHYESYYQTFNSIGVVFRCLPDDPVTTVDIYDKLIERIDEPFVLVCEKSDEGVIHWHMIWFTSKRSDNAKRLLQKYLMKFNISISCQQTRSTKHLLRYILKNPITVAIGLDEALKKYTMKILGEEPVQKEKETDLFPNQMVRDFINVMKDTRRYTFEELVLVRPDIMQKYLHKPNIEAIINNCKLYLLKPKRITETMLRLTLDIVVTDLFPLWFTLRYHDINAREFILDFWNVLFLTSDKHNVLCLQGPSNSGKTYFIRPLANIFNYGEVVTGGTFMFQNCINTEMIIWEEPLIGSDYAELCKRVFEGMTTQVNVKFKPPQTLYRTPVIMTTNKDVWHYCDSDESAFRNRMFHYNFTKDMPIGRCSRSKLREYYREYSEWLTDICGYISAGEPDDPDGFEYSTAASSSTPSVGSREFYQCSIIGNGFCSTHVSTNCGDYTRLDNNKRRKCYSSEGEQCTKCPRLTEHDSASIDSGGSRAGTPTRDSPRRGSDAEVGPTLYRNADDRGDCKLGTGFRLHVNGGGGDNIRRDHSDYRTIGRDIACLRAYGRRYKALEKIFPKGELQLEQPLDWSLSIPSNSSQWLTLIRLGFLIARLEGLY